MKTVLKYSLYPGITECAMPAEAQPLCVQSQRDQPCLWALVDPLAPTAIRRFVTYGTGHSLYESDRIRYIGTCQQGGGALVWHVFEQTTSPDLPAVQP